MFDVVTHIASSLFRPLIGLSWAGRSHWAIGAVGAASWRLIGRTRPRRV